MQLAAEVKNDGSVSEFVFATSLNSADYMKQGTSHYRLIHDHLGSPRLVVNSLDGTIVQRLDYNEWGNVIADSNPNFQPFAFAGGLYDADTKLTKFGARDYAASVARWNSKDPILFAGGDTNLYRYVFNNPTNLIDPEGKSPEDVYNMVVDFNRTVSDLTRNNLRTDPGYVNNVMRSLYDWTGGNYGKEYLGCGEQSGYVSDKLSSREYDDNWTFQQKSGFTPLYHQWTEAVSSNPNDPVVVIDPWNSYIGPK